VQISLTLIIIKAGKAAMMIQSAENLKKANQVNVKITKKGANIKD